MVTRPSLRCRGGRWAPRILGLAVGATMIGVLAGPVPAAACTGCGTTGDEVMSEATSIVLARYRETDGSDAVLEVLDVLKGRSVPVVRVRWRDLVAGGDWRTCRWIIAQDRRGLGPVFHVSASGKVVWPGGGGEGGIDDYPRTLAGWYRALGLSVPDTGTLPPVRPSQDSPGPAEPLVLLMGAFLGAALTQRRLTRPGRRHRSQGGLPWKPRVG